jgi:hypothetical protein
VRFEDPFPSEHNALGLGAASCRALYDAAARRSSFAARPSIASTISVKSRRAQHRPSEYRGRLSEYRLDHARGGQPPSRYTVNRAEFADKPLELGLVGMHAGDLLAEDHAAPAALSWATWLTRSWASVDMRASRKSCSDSVSEICIRKWKCFH